MVSSTQHKTKILEAPINISGAPKSRDKSEAADSMNPQGWQLQLSTSLDIREVLNHFFNGITTQIPCASLCYKNEQKNTLIELGGKKAHAANYDLNATGYNLGEITFTRSERFSEAELQQLETALSLLFYPLRNALLYKEAVDGSLRDSLTELANRAAFELAIKRELGMAKRHNQPLSMVMVDVDFFKCINDTVGHHGGDLLLTHIAKTLKSTLRETDQVFRVGGEEFVILLANTNLTAAQRVADRTRLTIANSPMPFDEQRLTATVSMGISTYCSEDSRDSLFERADEALYLAKNSGRNCIKTEWDCINDNEAASQ